MNNDTARNFNRKTIGDYSDTLCCPFYEIGGQRVKGSKSSKDKFKKKLSIITVVYNGVKFLEDAIKSVISQKTDEIEYLIIDAGSKDGTLDIIRRYEEHIDLWLSQEDKGIYDAFNKGIYLSRGELIKLVNADDLLVKDSIKMACQYYDKNKSKHFALYSDLVIIDKHGQYDCTWHLARTSKIFPNFLHPTWYISKNIYSDFGLYCTDFEVSADYEYYLHLTLNGIKFAQANSPLAKFRLNGASTSFRGVLEVFQINKLYFGPGAALQVAIKHALIKIFSRLLRTALGTKYHRIKSIFIPSKIK
ncbi:glycosyl transferase family 2 [Geothermobacter ehrlichii]|uniref:Glycosyl transferase family 2 n=1 Tax=Geothermobacter ehrlichii TaxID=213224 RepID=A0A5D3WJY8_9BACT|nr:glycosyltransferase family 2 protein [Geothermobacter ehrlichii]TYO98357.1 glycosyl transferase family 2 [Geothermobacter ehrlichii]